MPPLSSMFPRRYLSHEDLQPDATYEAVIAGVTLEAARAQRRGDKVEQETTWLLYLEGWPKPIKLSRSKANRIGAILRLDDTDHWTGCTVRFYRGFWEVGGESGECISFDDRPAVPGHAGLGVPAHLITGAPRGRPAANLHAGARTAALPGGSPPAAAGVWGVKMAQRYSERLREHNASTEAFLVFCDRVEPQSAVRELIRGRPIESWPVVPLSGLAKRWFDALADAAAVRASAPPPATSPLPGEQLSGARVAQLAAPAPAAPPEQVQTARGDVVDTTTGEVVRPAPGAPGSPLSPVRPGETPPAPDDTDIPF